MILFNTTHTPEAFAAKKVINPSNYDVEHVVIDSRSGSLGGHALFVALISPSDNGHHYIPNAYKQGVRVFLISEGLDKLQKEYPDACFILVEDTLESLQHYARSRRLASKAHIVAITGSNGKTIVKEMLYSLLYRDVEGLYRSPGSYNSQIGVALSLIAMPEDTRLAIIEAGISRPGEMRRLQEMILPDEVLITNIGTAHLENFSSQEALKREKLILTEGAKSVYYAPESEPKQYLTLLTKSPFGDRAGRQNLSLALTYIEARFPSIFDKVEQYIPQLEPVEMRLEVKENARGKVLINDSYSNDLVSLEIALEAQNRLGGHAIVLSPIEQSSLSAEELALRVRTLLSTYQTKKVYLLGWSLGQPSSGMVFIETSSIEELLSLYRDDLLDEYALLVKGARRYKLEELIHHLSKREHATRLEVNLSTIESNLAFYRSRLPHSASLICMIKADAYGLGALEIARALESSQVAYLAVAVADEGKALRQAGIKKPIIVMNPALDSLDTLVTYHLDAEIYSLEMLQRFAPYRLAQGYPGLHLKVDTGMHRLGFRHEDLEDVCRILEETKAPLSSVFSHFAGADDPKFDSFSQKQADYLKAFYDTLIERTSTFQETRPMLHLLNTAGLERFNDTYSFDGGRLGIGLYGYSPSGRTEVRPVATLKTRILQVKRIPKGEPIGYSCTISFPEDCDIAIIPIGYADGLLRRFGNGRWSVNIGGVLCPIIGNICMDACMVNVSGVKAKAGDEVIIFGDNQTPITDMAKVGDTIPYEILTSISPRVVRVYVRE